MRMFERRRQLALSDFYPSGVRGSAADGSDRAQRRSSKFCEFTIGQRFNFSDALKDRLKERRFVFGPGLEPRRKLGIVDRKAFPWLQKRIIAQSSGILRLHARRERRETVTREELFNDLTTGIRSAAGQPLGANPMAVDSELRGEDRVIAQKLDNQRRSERGHAVSGLRGAGRQKRGAAICGSGVHDR